MNLNIDIYNHATKLQRNWTHTLLKDSIFVQLKGITWRSISMRAGPAFLQFDWSNTSLSIDLPVFVYSHTKTSFKFLTRQGRYRKLSMWLQIFSSSNAERTLQLLFCLDPVCQALLIIEIVICIHYLIGSSPHAVRPATLFFG